MKNEKLTVLPAPLDTKTFVPTSEKSNDPKPGFTILYIGSISPMRFPAPLIRQAVEKAQTAIKQPITIQVFAPKATHPYNEAWQNDVLRSFSGMPNNEVSIQQKDLSTQEKVALYQGASLVIIPFQGPVAIEPPLTLLEAMACEALVAVSEHANRSKLVSPTKTGFLFSSARDLADTIIRVAGKNGNFTEIKQEARKTVVEQYSFPTISKRILEIWSELETKN
jgi:glycosyltransferase involved in cell wall biosynthesis